MYLDGDSVESELSFFWQAFLPLLLDPPGIIMDEKEHGDFAGIEKGLSQAVVSKIHAALLAKVIYLPS